MSTLSRNIIYNLAGQTILIVVSFISVRSVFQGLGEEALGIIYFAMTLNGVIRIAIITGIANTVIRELALNIDTDPNYSNALIQTSITVGWISYGISVLLAYFLSPLIVHDWLNLASMDSQVATSGLRILSIGILTVLPAAVYASVFRGIEQMQYTNIVEVTAAIFRQLGLPIVIMLGGGFIQSVQWITISFLIIPTAYLLLLSRYFDWRVLLKPQFQWKIFSRNKTFLLNSSLVSVLGFLQNQLDKLVISIFLPVGMLGYYTFAYSTVSKGAMIRAAVGTASFPALSALFGKADHEGLMAKYRQLQDVMCFGTLPIFAFIPFVSQPVFSYLFNSEVAQILQIPTLLLSIAIYVSATLGIPYNVAMASGKPEIIRQTNLYALLFTVPSSIYLVSHYSLNGAGFSLLLYHLFAAIYLVYRVSTECLQISPMLWYLHISRVIILALASYGVVGIALYGMGVSTFTYLLSGYLVATLIFVGGSLFLIDKSLINQGTLLLKRLQLKNAS